MQVIPIRDITHAQLLPTLPGERRASRSVDVRTPRTASMIVPLHAVVGVASLSLLAVVSVAALGTAVLLGLAFAAFVRRRSRPYLLLVAAFAALLGRSAVVAISALGLLSPTNHHLFEHGLDVVLVALVVAAVYYARTVRREVSAS
jgi:hypothetical protein